MNIQQRASRMRKPDRDSGGPSPRSEMSRRVLRGRLISDTAHRLRIPRIVEPMSGRGTGVMSVPCPAHHRSHARPRLRAAQIATTPLRRSHGREYFFRVVEQLKIHLPPCRPVIVLAGRPLSKKDGDCCVVRGKFQIRVSRQLNESEAVDVLMHEWAHALSWEACVGKVAHSRGISDHEFERLAHGPKWGLAFSRVYLCFTSEIVLTLLAEDLNAAVARGRRRWR